MHVAIIGMSADPAHEGHLHLSRAVQALGYDRVVWMLTPQNPLKRTVASPLEHRLELARLRAEGLPWLQISDFEQGVPVADEDLRTRTMLRAYRQTFPAQRPTFVMGADNMAQFHLWGGFADIVRENALLVVPRAGAVGAASSTAGRVMLASRDVDCRGPVRPGQWRELTGYAEHPANSTAIREAVRQGQAAPWLTQAQQEYLTAHGLYTG